MTEESDDAVAIEHETITRLAKALPAAGFLVRTFVVFHDCAHGSLLASRRANRWVGRLLGLLVLSPFGRWRHDSRDPSRDLRRSGAARRG